MSDKNMGTEKSETALDVALMDLRGQVDSAKKIHAVLKDFQARMFGPILEEKAAQDVPPRQGKIHQLGDLLSQLTVTQSGIVDTIRFLTDAL